MIKKIVSTSLAALILINISYGQNELKYKELVNKALKLYEGKEFSVAGRVFSDAFQIMNEKSYLNDRYIAACSWVLGNETDSAFSQLFKVVRKSNFLFEGYVVSNPGFNVLHSDKRWDLLLELINNKENDETIQYKSLSDTLYQIYFADVKSRVEVKKKENEFGFNSDTARICWKKIEANDSATLVRVQKLLDKYGWLGSDKIGALGNRTLFLAIQHADLKTQIRYLPLMKAAVQNGNASPGNFAYLADRVALRQGKKQLYGTQLGRSHSGGQYYIAPLEDPENVDRRRAEAGLEKLEDFVSFLGIAWDAEDYKRKLPAIEIEYWDQQKKDLIK